MKQMIVMRKDLHMRKGKIAAQAGHACVEVLLMIMQKRKLTIDTIYQDKNLSTWFNEGQAKICVYVESEAALLSIYNKAINHHYLTSLIKDAGKTEFHNQETYTCLAIEPLEDNQINQITGGLPLY